MAEDDDDFSSLLSRFSSIRTEEPEELVMKWSEIMSVTPEEANFYLSAANYNLEIALNLFLDARTRERNAATGQHAFSAHLHRGFPYSHTTSGLEGVEDTDLAVQIALAESVNMYDTPPAAEGEVPNDEVDMGEEMPAGLVNAPVAHVNPFTGAPAFPTASFGAAHPSAWPQHAHYPPHPDDSTHFQSPPELPEE